jgi:putative protease
MEAELLAPAGDFKTALAAFEAGADAVYCGLSEFSARAFATNLSFEELDNLVRYARVHRKKVYVTFNTLIDEDDMEEAVRQLARIAEIGPDALIVQDIGIARLCRLHFPELELHASTQLVAHNLEGVLALGEIGFKRVVLARELSLAEIAAIVKRSGGMEFECFIHGALCYSISGLCLFGAMEKGRSGNRGKCPYCCRLPWESEDGGRSLVFSMRDLGLGEDVIKLVDA